MKSKKRITKFSFKKKNNGKTNKFKEKTIGKIVLMFNRVPLLLLKKTKMKLFFKINKLKKLLKTIKLI